MLTSAAAIIRRFPSSRQATIASTLAVVLMSTAQSWAAPRLIDAQNDPEISSSFTLDIPAFAFQRAAMITQTEIRFRIDPQTTEAGFVSYYQDVDELFMPNPVQGEADISTGPLVIQIIPGFSSGSYDEETGVFSTVDTFSVSFDSELGDAFASIYGIESPQILPDVVSSGIVVFDTRRTGTLNLAWIGSDLLATSFGDFPFSYTCNVNTKFVPVLVTNVEFAALDGAIHATETDPTTKGELLGSLNDVIEAMASAGDGSLIAVLDSFIDFVEQQRGDTIYDVDADALVEAAESMIDAAQPNTSSKELIFSGRR